MDSMTPRERFKAVMNFEPFDRLPVVEWAPWWGLTVDRWHEEGLPVALNEYDINRYLNMDVYITCYVHGLEALSQELRDEVGPVSNMDDYERVRELLYPWPVIDRDWWAALMPAHERGEIVICAEPMGYFFYARDLLGIEPHLYAFYDQPELLHRINDDLANYHMKIFDELCSFCCPDYISWGEDMSYNYGPMLSKSLFDEFMLPYYERVLPRLKDHDICHIVDSDGNITEPAGWFEEAGIEGILPLERQAGVDVSLVRRQHPTMRFIGCFDKLTMHKGEAAMRAEFERLLPVAKQGGLIISVDHQTPPGVSYQDYQLYLRLFREYAEEVGRASRA